MSCGCQNKRLGQELERIRRLAKAFAKSEGVTVGIIKKADDTYGFGIAADVEANTIIEYITPY